MTESIWTLCAGWPEFRGLYDALRKGQRELAAYGVSRPASAMVLAALRQATGRPLVVLAADWDAARGLADDLSAWLGPQDVALFPPAEFVPYGIAAQSRELAAQRLDALARFAAGEAGVAVAPVAAATRRLLPVDAWRDSLIPVEAGMQLGLETLAARLVDLGYEPVETVETPGSFARRGGLLDVYPLVRGEPLRIEFFGDEVDSLRRFDPDTQTSIEGVQRALLHPAREATAAAARRSAAAQAMRADAARLAARLEEGGGGQDAARRLAEYADELAERLVTDAGGAAWEVSLTYLYEQPGWLADYLGHEAITVYSEPLRLAERAAELDAERRERYASLLGDGRLLPRQLEILASWDDLKRRQADGQTLLISLMARHSAEFQPSGNWSLGAQDVPPFHGQQALFRDELTRWRRSGYRVVVCVGDDDRARRLADDLDGNGLETTVVSRESMSTASEAAHWPAPPPGAVWICAGGPSHGAQWPGMRLVVVGEADIVGERPHGTHRRAPAKRAVAGQPGGLRITRVEDLAVGDYVVHAHHGIGQYLGTRTMTVQGVQRDYLHLRYEGQDRLYVPTDQIDLVQKYVGSGEAKPHLYKLGGNEWQRVKQRVRESVQKMAEELLELYAARQSLRGHAFPSDSAWQHEFEAAFPYDETPDQMQAIADVKRDMERPQPMDRLLCGDVGYGKTEVAIRAAFKAVMDGKQVAVLVPTTILAEQHFLTFSERFEGFPVKVQMLSRFRTAAEQAQTITGLRTGDVDIVVGTHRLVQEDVSFKDLGLLVVDEEQRFGVAHKERLKQLRRTVDVLTLTATPIPRTLHMAMAGLRDMSVIETPPKNRYPVETYVAEFSDAMVREAVERERARGGQVFYLHNHVRTIHRAGARLARLVPEADVVVAHGQMAEHELEKVMVEFLRGRHDVLLCTTIIESGLDIPNVNTLIVEDADRLGLAQLYQIRGRVGRSDRLAFAHFTFHPKKILSEVAEKRLQALKEFTELGSGLRIALRDLELRGAGNILGPEQHGFMAQVGFEMYTELLEDAVRELKGERRVPETRTSVELRVDAFLPDDYVAATRHKLEFYKKINEITALPQADEVAYELMDRFGEPPQPVQNLLELARLRVRCGALGVLGLSQDGAQVRLGFAGYMQPMMDDLAPLLQQFRRRLTLDRSSRPALRLRVEQAQQPLAEIGELLDAVAALPAVARWQSSEVTV